MNDFVVGFQELLPRVAQGVAGERGLRLSIQALLAVRSSKAHLLAIVACGIADLSPMHPSLSVVCTLFNFG